MTHLWPSLESILVLKGLKSQYSTSVEFTTWGWSSCRYLAHHGLKSILTLLWLSLLLLWLLSSSLLLSLLLLLFLFGCHAGEAVSHGGQETRLDTASHNQHHWGGILEPKVGLQQHRLTAASSSSIITPLCATGPQKVAWFAEGAAFDAISCWFVSRHFTPLTGSASQADTTNQQQKGQMFHLAYKDKLRCAVLCCRPWQAMIMSASATLHAATHCGCTHAPVWGLVTKVQKSKEKKRKDYAFRRQLNEKPSIISGCPGITKVLLVS